MAVAEEKEEAEKMAGTKYKLRVKSLSLICMGLELSGDRLSSP